MADPACYLELLRAAGASLQRVHRALLSPRNNVWESCGPQLDAAVGLLEALERELSGDPGLDLELKSEIRRQMARLRRDLAQIHRLMEAAADSYLGWAQLLSAAVNGYSGMGTVPPLEAPALVSVQG